MATQPALERGARNPLFPVGSAYASGTSPNELGLGVVGDLPYLVDSFTVDVIVSLNGGTVTAGTLTVDVSDDGVHWTDSGVAAVTIPTTDGGYAIIAVSKFNSAAKMPVRFARAKINGATKTGSPTVDIALSA